MLPLHRLRARAISHSLFPPSSLRTAIDRLDFVQADPIRSPARAQDLILRHRVTGDRAGGLERHYPLLNVEEDSLYAYGFVSRRVWRLIHPRKTTGLSALERKVFEVVRKFGRMHPRELESHLGRERVINAWGGYSKATTQALDDLHYRGLLRVARRENGIRTYEAAPPPADPLPPAERLRQLVLAIASILAPAPQKTLQANLARYRRLGNVRTVLSDMRCSGELESETVDGLAYVWPASVNVAADEPSAVRFLAPFDPLVWDRRRFEHFWNWPYRFEAYTPVAKRIRGYYAMPMLWRHQIIGWANANVAGGRLDVEVGFVDKRPREKDFRVELDAEIARLEWFLGEQR